MKKTMGKRQGFRHRIRDVVAGLVARRRASARHIVPHCHFDRSSGGADATAFLVLALSALLLPASPALAACVNPAGVAGQVLYNSDHNVLQYCDDVNWVAMGSATYTPKGAGFDGSTRLKRGGPLTGVTDSTQLTMSFWVRFNNNNDWQRVISSPNSDDVFVVHQDNTDRLRIRLSTPGYADGFVALSNSTRIADGNWHHVLFSINAGTATHLYIDGIYELNIQDAAGAGALDFTLSDWGFGAEPEGNINPFSGDLADVWIDFGTYFDFSDSAQREKFYANGPVYLGNSGEHPTGSAPEIFLAGDSSTWHTNKGTGGGFTKTGTLSPAATDPGQKASCPPVAPSAHWRFDEGSGTKAADDVGTKDGTLTGGPVWASGQIGSALTFNGTTNYVDVPATMGFGDQYTITGWFKTTTLAQNQTIFGAHAGGVDGDHISFMVEKDYCAVPCLAGRTDVGGSWQNYAVTSTVPITTNEWHFGAFVVDGLDLAVYLDGNAPETRTIATDAPFSASAEIGRTDTNWAYNYFSGSLDDIRVFDRALTASEVAAIYNGGAGCASCAEPSGVEGQTIYNSDADTLQYCNGADWVAIGDTPLNAGLAAHWRFDDGSGGAASDYSGNGNDGTLTNMNTTTDWVTGQIGSHALNFDGIDGNIDVLSSPDTKPTGPFSVTGWIYARATANGGIVRGPDADGWNEGWRVAFDASSSLQFTTNTASGGTKRVTSTHWRNDWLNKWHHFAATYDGANVRLYVDGVLRDTDAQSGTITYLDSRNLLIGYSSGAAHFDGYIDDVRLYNRALSDAEIAALAIPVGPGEANVTWDPVNKGASITLSNNNRDATSANEGIAVTSHGLNNSTLQKVYVEMEIVLVDNNIEVAVKDNDFSILNDWHEDINGSNVTYDQYSDALETKGAGWTLNVAAARPNLITGDRVMWALDRENGKIWYGVNGTWVASGNPATGANPTFNAVSTATWHPSALTADNAIIRLHTREASFAYAVPSGFTSLAKAVNVCANPAGRPGATIYNSTLNIMQTCTGGEWQAIGK